MKIGRALTGESLLFHHDTYNDNVDICTHAILKALPLVVAHDTSTYFHKVTSVKTGAITVFVESAKELIMETIKEMAINPSHIGIQLQSKLSTMDVIYGFPNMSNGVNFGETYFPLLYGDISQLDPFSFLKIIIRTKQQKILRGLTEKHKHMWSKDITNLNPYDTHPAYDSTNNKLYIPISVIWSTEYNNKPSESDCDRGKNYATISSTSGSMIIRSIIDSLNPYIYPYYNGMYIKDNVDIFKNITDNISKSISEVSFSFYDNDIMKKLVFPVENSKYIRRDDMLVLHLSYYTMTQIFRDQSPKVGSCINSLLKLFFHLKSTVSCLYPSPDMFKILYGRDRDFNYLPEGVRLETSFLSFTPYRDLYECTNEPYPQH
eukprot:GHVR01190528.1.p1 GENE.GHVR01190528.1~~GHVR01190528.1.p1  ORF type:complete len:376 (+),score=46.99 GHVR01190528.1:569-1696(+)